MSSLRMPLTSACAFLVIKSDQIISAAADIQNLIDQAPSSS